MGNFSAADGKAYLLFEGVALIHCESVASIAQSLFYSTCGGKLFTFERDLCLYAVAQTDGIGCDGLTLGAGFSFGISPKRQFADIKLHVAQVHKGTAILFLLWGCLGRLFVGTACCKQGYTHCKREE